jgi:lipopolysaccharide export LptBFGC system permease protein LptF
VQTNYLYSPAFKETPDEVRSEVRVSPGLSLKQARKADIPLTDLLSYIRFHPRLPDRDYAWVHTKMHGRLATPWTCLLVVLIAIPFGAPSGRRNVFVGVAGSIFICFAYFGLQQLGLTLGSGNVLPPWLGAWLPNLLFGSTAVYFIFRVR